MERRVVDIAEGRRHLSKRRGALVIEKGRSSGNPTELLVPFDEIESVIVHTPQATYSNAVLMELAQRLIPVVCCDQAHTPVAWLWPAQGNFEQSRRMAAQAVMGDGLRAGLWQRIVRAKIEAQAALLVDEGYDAGPLPAVRQRRTARRPPQRRSTGGSILLEAALRRDVSAVGSGASAEWPAQLRLRHCPSQCGPPSMRRRLAPIAWPAPPQPLQRFLPRRRLDGAFPPHR